MNLSGSDVIAICAAIVSVCALIYGIYSGKRKADSEAVKLDRDATQTRLASLEKRSDECEERERGHLAEIRQLTHDVRQITNEKMDLMMKLIYRGDQSEHTAALVADTESRKQTSTP